MKKAALSIGLSLVLLFPKAIFADSSLPAPLVNSPLVATTSFSFHYSFTQELTTTYFIKVRIGVGSSFNKAQTFNASTNSWLNDTNSWNSFPKVTTDSSGTWSDVLVARTVSSISLGENQIEISLRKLSTTTNLVSPSSTLVVTAAPLPPPPPPASSIHIFLNEFMANPENGQEWVEIYNPSTSDVDITGWKLDDGPESSSPTTIKEGEIVTKGFKVFDIPTKLNNAGDTLRLLKPDGSEYESVDFGSSESGVSFAKDSAEAWQQTLTPTPGAANKITKGEVLGENDSNQTKSSESKSDSLSINVLKDLVATPSSQKDQKPIKTEVLIKKSSTKDFLPVILIGVGILLTFAATLSYLLKIGFFKKLRRKKSL